MKTILILFVLIMNLLGFAMMGVDKSRARKHQWRIPERTLFLAALLFGSVGILTGMYFFRHKTRHLSFTIGIPAILVLQLLLLGLLLSWNQKHMGSPSQAVQRELSLIQSLDTSTIKSYVSYETLTNSHISPGQIDEEAIDAVALFFQDFHYRILNEQVDGDAATVNVSLTNRDMHALAQDLCTEILRQTAAIYPSEQTMTTSDYYHLLYETLSSETYSPVVTTASFHLKKEETGWRILADETLEDALVGGFISYMNDPYILPVSTVLDLQLASMKELSAKDWKRYLEIEDLFATYNADYSEAIDDAYVRRLAEAYDYEILKCRETGDTASATVRITSLDMPGILAEYKKYLLAYAATTQSVRDNDIQVSNEVSRLLLQALEESTGTNATDIDLTFTNNGKAWEIYFGSDFTNAVMGDINTAMDTFSGAADSEPAPQAALPSPDSP